MLLHHGSFLRRGKERLKSDIPFGLTPTALQSTRSPTQKLSLAFLSDQTACALIPHDLASQNGIDGPIFERLCTPNQRLLLTCCSCSPRLVLLSRNQYLQHTFPSYGV